MKLSKAWNGLLHIGTAFLEKQKPDIKASRMSDPVALNVRLRSLGRVLSWSLALAAMRKPYLTAFR